MTFATVLAWIRRCLGPDCAGESQLCPEIVELVRRTTDLCVRVIGMLPSVQGKGLVQLCPFHEEQTARLVIYPDGRFHCFGCGTQGKVDDDGVLVKE